MAQRFRWHPAPVGGAAPVAATTPAAAPNNPWTNPSHPTARAAMAAAPAVAANNPGVARWDPVPVAAAAPDAAPNTGHHRRWHPAPLVAAASSIQHVHYPIVAAPNNPWNNFASRPHYGVYPEIYPMAQPAPMYHPGGGGNIQFHRAGLRGPEPIHYQAQNGARYQIVPQDPGPNEFWCRELDGTYTLRTMNTVTHDLQPGEWRNHPDTGYPYWYRLKA
ncbi:hypothetical protein ABVK25_010657 [Lepraria finkii]|uniref:Uncharacterized protein n=1 Tax=Lepraria finkii TaxID=1340010 RepID=A0ABR4ATZ6_9LECA